MSAQQQPKKKVDLLVRKARQDELEVVVQFEQALAQETEGRTLDADCIGRGVDVPLRQPHLAQVYVAVLRDDSDSASDDASAATGSSGGEAKPTVYAGFMTVGTQWSEWYGGFMHWILSTYVNAEFRGQGVFSQLYRHVKRTVQGDRISVGMRLYVERENMRAQATYKKLGMHVEDYVMFKWMKPSDALPAKGDDVPLPPATPIRPTDFPEEHPWTIRLATAADLPQLVELQVANAKEDGIELDMEAIRRGVAMPWAEPCLARMYVAEMEGQLVGVLMVTNEWSEWKGGIVYWLTSIYVLPAYRNRGILTSLFHFAKAQVEREPNTVGFRMQVLKSNAKGLRLAQKLGMAEEPYYLMRWMDPNGAVVSRGYHPTQPAAVGTPTAPAPAAASQ